MILTSNTSLPVFYHTHAVRNFPEPTTTWNESSLEDDVSPNGLNTPYSPCTSEYPEESVMQQQALVSNLEEIMTQRSLKWTHVPTEHLQSSSGPKNVEDPSRSLGHTEEEYTPGSSILLKRTLFYILWRHTCAGLVKNETQPLHP